MEQRDFWESNLSILRDRDNALYEALVNFEEESQRIYYLDETKEGEVVLTLENQGKKVRMCSARNPVREGMLFAKANCVDVCERYIVFGFAMGYHIEGFLAMTTREVVVLESDLEILAVCMRFRDMHRVLENPQVKIVYCKELMDYISWLREKEGDVRFCMWEPSIKTISNASFREILENYKVLFDSMEVQGQMLLENFRKNIQLEDESVDNLLHDFYQKDMILLAGGPSLDDNLDMLRKLQDRENMVMVCVGKVAKRLLQEKIIPDYLVMIDGKAGTYWQIDGIETCGVPLIYLSTVAANVASGYKGKRYIACQAGMEEAKDYAIQKGYTVYESGGSVATFAIDMGIRMGCRRIICVGLDLGYAGEDTHAGGVGRKIVNEESLRQVEGVHGTMVRTSKTLDIYRRWIERRIEDIEDTKCINASGGARIYGMIEKKLEEIF